MKKTTSIYALCDPACLGGRIRYIGKADDVTARFAVHLSSARHGERGHKANWLRSLFAQGLAPQVVTIEAVPAGRDWQKIERDYIAAHRAAGVPLTNQCDGGEGISGLERSPETREKIRVSMTGKTRSMEHRANLSVAMSGEKHPLFGKHHSVETREKMSAANKGRIFSVEACEKMSAARKGIKFSPEHCAKLSFAQTGRKRSAETREKMSAAHRGLKYRIEPAI
jgi:hypothetical protein